MKSLLLIWCLVVITGFAAWGTVSMVFAAGEGPGPCAGYPDGRCEFNPDGVSEKDPAQDLPDPNRSYYDGNGVEHAADGTVINTPASDLDPYAIANK